MRIGEIVASRLIQLESKQADKVTKVGAGYVFVPGSNYRCFDCWKFIPATHQCAEMRARDVVRKNGTCIMWAHGTPTAGLKASGAYTPQELGYTEDPKGTKCARCMFFDVQTGKYCQRVDEKSTGDTPGRIDPGACCANQTPRGTP